MSARTERPTVPTAVRERVRTQLPRVEAAGLRAAMGLPERVQRLLAGKPVVREGQTLATDLQLMLRLQRVARKVAAETLPVPEGRLALAESTALIAGRQPIGSVRDLQVAGQCARLYTPSGVSGDAGPLLVFFHGGGFIYCDLETHDAGCRFLAERSGVRVLSVEYRLAPEAPFPAAHDDAVAAYRWVLENLDTLGADRDRLAVGGDSAGGNLAASVAITAAQEGLPLAFQLLVYPMTDGSGTMPSRTAYGKGFFLTAEFMDLASRSFAPTPEQGGDPRLSVLHADLPPGLAPAYVATAGFDPLRDEGEAYARKLADAGVGVELRRFRDQIHGFLNIVGVGRSSRAANAEIAARLRAGLGAAAQR
ncbi:alpha/beta hydrolase [Nocardioides pantholopis]|uniref:alpha/beta hydrolase n=1 Tax=Nocardioides pantholopis TaxID=2483798 RepID=UPI001F14AA86|nr:alpha/beta hydrolase [Nocardioides pantholopis]